MDAIIATGRRKTSIARVRLLPGTGKITVNKKDSKEYFQRETLLINLQLPLVVTESLGQYDVQASVYGGGISGQAGAVRLGIARALVKINEDFRSKLRANGLMTRDPRMVERKKYGMPGARKRFQYSKR